MTTIYSRFNHGEYPGVVNCSPSLTQQHFANDANINTIVDRYARTGILPVRPDPAIFADCSTVPTDYMEAIQRVRNADAVFSSLPSRVRAEFDNNPGQFLLKMADPDFIPRSIELGLRDFVPTQPNNLAASDTPTE